MHQFERLAIWQRSITLAADLQRRAMVAPASCRPLFAQIARAAHSVPANISEGAQRASQRDFARFLSIALASAAELQTLLAIAGESGAMPSDVAARALLEAFQVRRMIVSLRARVLNPLTPRNNKPPEA